MAANLLWKKRKLDAVAGAGEPDRGYSAAVGYGWKRRHPAMPRRRANARISTSLKTGGGAIRIFNREDSENAMELDVRLLRTFRAIADSGSFTGAARKLRLTQSSVSQQVGALERNLGVQLLKRSNKFVGLTTAGEIFLQCARQVLDNLDRVKEMLAEHSKTASGHLSIGAPALFCHSLLPTMLGAFRHRFPRIALSVVTADPDSMAARLASRELDVALLPYPISQQSLGMVPLGRDELVAIVHPRHELAPLERLSASDLSSKPLIVPTPGDKLWAAWDNFLVEAGVFPEIGIETDDLEVAKRLAIEGQGISVAPRWAVRAEVEAGKLRAIALRSGGVFRQWCLAYHYGAQLIGTRRNFFNLCHEEMPRLLGHSGLRRREERTSRGACLEGTELGETSGLPHLKGA
jgi:DNA-binding transcriptional LysR family regulator